MYGVNYESINIMSYFKVRGNIHSIGAWFY